MKEFEITQSKKFSLNLGELWEFKELFYFFTWRDIKVKYKQTALGFLWAILQPALMLAVFSFLFRKLVNSQVPAYLPYPLFVCTGLILWNIFATGLQNAGNSMVNNSNIIKKIYFPRLIIPMSAVLTSIFDFLITCLLFVALILFYKPEVNWLRLFVCFPIAITITILSTFGVGTFMAALNVKYRDFRYIIPFLIQFLMFVTPIFYPMTIIENSIIKFILLLNPLIPAIDLGRSVFIHNPIDWMSVTAGLALSIFWVIIGIFYFRKTESYFADLS